MTSTGCISARSLFVAKIGCSAAKIGVTRGDYENVFDSGTETGLAYGIGLTSGNEDFRIHWLDYEVHRVGDEEFKTVSVNLLIVVCVLGIFYGGPCFN